MSAETARPHWLRRLLDDQVVRFVVVGGLNTAVSTGLFIGFDLWFGRFVYSFVPLLAAWAISLVGAFFLHRGLVFAVRGHVLRDLGRFALVNSGALGINVAALFVASDIFRWPRIPAQLAITAVIVTVSFVGHKYFSFRRTDAELQAQGVASPQD